MSAIGNMLQYQASPKRANFPYLNTDHNISFALENDFVVDVNTCHKKNLKIALWCNFGDISNKSAFAIPGRKAVRC